VTVLDGSTMKRKQIIVVAVSAGVALFCAWSVWRLVREMTDAAAAEQQRNAARSQLEGMFQLKPFPSEANRKRAMDDSAKMKAWIDSLGALLVDAQAPTSLSPQLFMQNLWEKMNELAQLPSGGGARLAPDDFAFGFDRYRRVADGRAPEPEDVPRLSLQLKMIDRICRELSAAGVLSLTSIQRDQFEVRGAKPADDLPDTGRGRPGRRPQKTAVPAPSKGAVPVERSVRHRFTFEFTARQNAVCEVLNRLAAMELFVVVSDVAIRKSADDLKMAPVAVAADGAGGKETPRSNTLDAMQRVVAGPLIDPPLNVRIDLDVHVFEGV